MPKICAICTNCRADNVQVTKLFSSAEKTFDKAVSQCYNNIGGVYKSNESHRFRFAQIGKDAFVQANKSFLNRNNCVMLLI